MPLVLLHWLFHLQHMQIDHAAKYAMEALKRNKKCMDSSKMIAIKTAIALIKPSHLKTFKGLDCYNCGGKGHTYKNCS